MGSFSCQSNTFSYEMVRRRTRFETEAQGDKEMAYCLVSNREGLGTSL